MEKLTYNPKRPVTKEELQSQVNRGMLIENQQLIKKQSQKPGKTNPRNTPNAKTVQSTSAKGLLIPLSLSAEEALKLVKAHFEIEKK